MELEMIRGILLVLMLVFIVLAGIEYYRDSVDSNVGEYLIMVICLAMGFAVTIIM